MLRAYVAGLAHDCEADCQGAVDAIGAWQPNSGNALKAVAGSKPVFTSADLPGIIYDALYDPEKVWKHVQRTGKRSLPYGTKSLNSSRMRRISMRPLRSFPHACRLHLKNTNLF